MATKKFPLGRCRALADKVAALHEELQGILTEYDATAEDDVRREQSTGAKPAEDDSDAGTTWGQDSNRTLSLSEAIPGLNRLARSKLVRP